MTEHGLPLAPRRGDPPGKPLASRGNRGAEFAWRVHMAQVAWSSNADVKVSVLLALEAGALYVVISAIGHGGLAGSKTYPVVGAIGLIALLLAIIAGVMAIFPRLGQGNHDRGPHVIYFGDLRRWDTAELTSHIAGLTEGDELGMLSRQLTEISRRNWAKHLWVRRSLVLALTGILIIAVLVMTAL